MFGIEVITTRRRRQLELSEHRLKLNFVRSTFQAILDELVNERQTFFEVARVQGTKTIADQEDRDELVRLDHLILDGRIVADHLNGLEDKHGA